MLRIGGAEGGVVLAGWGRSGATRKRAGEERRAGCVRSRLGPGGQAAAVGLGGAGVWKHQVPCGLDKHRKRGERSTTARVNAHEVEAVGCERSLLSDLKECTRH